MRIKEGDKKSWLTNDRVATCVIGSTATLADVYHIEAEDSSEDQVEEDLGESVRFGGAERGALVHQADQGTKPVHAQTSGKDAGEVAKRSRPRGTGDSQQCKREQSRGEDRRLPQEVQGKA